jgi:hypothetical protein
LRPKIFRSPVGLLNGVAGSEDPAVGGVDEPINEVLADQLAGVFVDGLGLVDEEGKFHDAVAEHIVEDEGDSESAVDAQLLEDSR